MDRQKKIIMPTALIMVLLALWEFLVWKLSINSYVLPTPSAIIKALVSERATLFSHSLVTLKETALGLLLASVSGVALAILMDAFPLFKAAIYPILVVSQTVPVIVLAPIFIIWLGFGLAPKILTVVLMCFFPIVVNFADGMGQIDQNQINLLRSFGANRLQVYGMVKIPAAAPTLFSGLKVAATYSISGAVVGEWLSSSSGLGYYMLRVKSAYRLDRVFACVLVVVALSLLMNGLVKLLQLFTMPHERRAALSKG